jgi:hypothetical protein
MNSVNAQQTTYPGSQRSPLAACIVDCSSRLGPSFPFQGRKESCQESGFKKDLACRIRRRIMIRLFCSPSVVEMETSDQHQQYTRPQHLNPFYIESNDGLSLRGEYDNSDDDWRGDYGDFERKGLLYEDDAGENDNGFSHSRPSMDRNGFARSHRNRHVLGRNSSGGLLCRLFMAFGFVFVFFLVILTIIARNDPRDPDRQRIYRPSDSDETPPPSSSDHMGSLVVNDSRAEDGSPPSLHPTSMPTSSPTQPISKEEPPEIVVFGERSSGAPWLRKQLRGFYPSLNISSELTRSTYWFQDPPDSSVDSSIPSRRIFIAIFRNVYDWTDQMRRYPRFMPGHISADGVSTLQWEDFVNREWSIHPRPSVDQDFLSGKQNQVNATCQFDFRFDQVISCMPVDSSNDRYNPVYELPSLADSQRSYEHIFVVSNTTSQSQQQRPFKNVLALRAAKIKHILDTLPFWWKPSAVIVVKYEQSIGRIMTVIQNRTLVDPSNKWSSSLLERYFDNSFIPQQSAPTSPVDAESGDEYNVDVTSDPEYVDWITKHVDWETEARIGYSARTS